MSKDISSILAGWSYLPDEVSVRIVTGDDGRPKIQMRLDLGLLQMELDGRPDGQRPEDCESWLEYFERQAAAHQAEDPEGDSWVLEPEQCELLLREGIQYYHRYLSFWNLERYELCARDTKRNLRLFAFVRNHARRQKDKLQFDQWRPYVTMMHSRAVATPLVELHQFEAALAAIDAGIRGIQLFLEEYQQTHRAETCSELSVLQRWRKEVEQLWQQSATSAGLPSTELRSLGVEELREQMHLAVEAEDFEEAARLRDQIRRLEADPPVSESGPKAPS